VKPLTPDIALEWWAQCTTERGIPFHSVAMGLHTNYGTLRQLLRQRGIIAGSVDDTYVAVEDAHSLLQQVTGTA
jgi:hypothetical protein